MTLSASSGLSEVGESQLRFFIVRSPRRRTMQLRVGVRGVEVRVPIWVPDQEINEFVTTHQGWIQRAMGGVGPAAFNAPGVFADGGTLYVMGSPWILEVHQVAVGRPSLEERSDGWRVAGDSAAVKKLLFKWYHLKARTVFAQRVAYWAGVMGLREPGIVIKDQERLWGSYSSRTRKVNLNWRMISFPLTIIDYIVIHELCHARHMDHSRFFWREVEHYCPDWKARRLWLRTSARPFLVPS